MVVRMTVFGATGGASKASDKCSFAKVVEMERVDATGGASKARMPEACVPKGFARTQSQLSTHRPSPYEKRAGECGKSH